MQTFLELLARNALGAALLAGVVLALMPIVRRPAARNALWLIVFARLFLPPIWSIPLMPAREAPANQSANVLPTEGIEGTAAVECHRRGQRWKGDRPQRGGNRSTRFARLAGSDAFWHLVDRV